MKKSVLVLKRVATFAIVFVLLASLFVTILSAKAANNITVKGVDIIYTNPGEDCSTQITISWHAKSARSQLMYTTKNDPNYVYGRTISVLGKYDDTSFTKYDVAAFYKCYAELKDLEPDTEYIYKIRCEDFISSQFTFKTAGASEFTFGYMSDIHAIPYDNLELGMTAVKKMQTVQTLLNQAEKVNNTKLAFVMTTGDETWRGSQYSNWLEWSKTQYTSALQDYLWLSCAGNHEYYTQTTSSVWNYYPDKYASNTSAIYSDPEYFYNTYFNSVKQVPKNGPKGVESCYYTLYNNILFICIDSMQAKEYKHMDEIKAWFGDVVKKNEGKYQYIIAYQHYPWYDFVTGTIEHAQYWSEVFDQYGVDLALSGHMHGYLRTKSLFGGKATTEEGKGTVYVVSPQIGDRPKVISGYTNKELFAYRESTKEWPDYSAMSTISVNSEGLTYKLIDVQGKVRDTFTIPARRALAITDEKRNDVINSLTLSSSSNSIVCDFKSSLSVYVEKIKLEVGGKSAEALPSADRVGYVKVNGLSDNTLNNAKVTITFIDGTTYEETVGVVTTNVLGLIDNLKAISKDGKMQISFDVSNEKSYEYKLYLNGELKATSANKLFELNLNEVDFDTKYSLEVFDNSKLIFHKDFYYNVYGDVNLDGVVNRDDAGSLIEKLLAGYNFNAGAIKLLDNNGDGIVDIGDAFKILAFAENKVEHIVYKTYEVTFVGFDNKTLSKVEVIEGGTATAPQAPVVDGYTFAGWSISYTNVTSNLIVRAVYEAN